MHKTLEKSVTLCTIALTLGLSGCGGGSGSGLSDNNNNFSTAADEAPAIENIARSGTVIIEERSGKTVFDAWFEASNTQTVANGLTTIFSGDRCNVLDHRSISSLPETLSGAPSLSISDGGSNLAMLVPQRIPSVTVYTTEERWSDEALSNDSVLSFDASSDFHVFSPMSLSALAPFEWVAPSSGAMTDINGLLQWVPAQGDNTHIEINLSTSEASAPVETAVAVVCYLEDDGEFSLSPDMQATLGNGATPIVVRGLRVRQQTVESDEASLAVVQISHEI